MIIQIGNQVCVDGIDATLIHLLCVRVRKHHESSPYKHVRQMALELIEFLDPKDVRNHSYNLLILEDAVLIDFFWRFLARAVGLQSHAYLKRCARSSTGWGKHDLLTNSTSTQISA